MYSVKHAFTESCAPFLTIYQTSLSDDDPLCPFAGIISGIYFFFCNYFQVFKVFDLYTV